MSEPVEEEEEEEEPEQAVGNESYVNLQRKLSKRYDLQARSVCEENARICAQFRLRKVWAQRGAALPTLAAEAETLCCLSGSSVPLQWCPHRLAVWFCVSVF